jgi:hypothetical protein
MDPIIRLTYKQASGEKPVPMPNSSDLGPENQFI